MTRAGLLLFCVALLASCGTDPCQAPYSCPLRTDAGAAVVDCTPPGDGAPECTGQCHAWLIENCDVTFLF